MEPYKFLIVFTILAFIGTVFIILKKSPSFKKILLLISLVVFNTLWTVTSSALSFGLAFGSPSTYPFYIKFLLSMLLFPALLVFTLSDKLENAGVRGYYSIVTTVALLTFLFYFFIFFKNNYFRIPGRWRGIVLAGILFLLFEGFYLLFLR